MTRETPKLGDFVKAWLPGETPWAECVAVEASGAWHGRIANKLVPEHTPQELARYMEGCDVPELHVPKRHDYRENMVVRFAWDSEQNLWTPREMAGGTA